MKRGTLEIIVGAIVVLIGFGFVHYAYSGRQVKTVAGYTVNAHFHRVGTIQLGAPVKVAGFVRFQLGEGIEKQESDFAAEVKAAAGS